MLFKWPGNICRLKPRSVFWIWNKSRIFFRRLNKDWTEIEGGHVRESPSQLQDQSRWLLVLGVSLSPSETAEAQAVAFSRGDLVVGSREPDSRQLGCTQVTEVRWEATGTVAEYNEIWIENRHRNPVSEDSGHKGSNQVWSCFTGLTTNILPGQKLVPENGMG